MRIPSAHGVKASTGLIFVSGQTALDEAGNKVPGGIKEHAVGLRKLSVERRISFE